MREVLDEPSATFAPPTITTSFYHTPTNTPPGYDEFVALVRQVLPDASDRTVTRMYAEATRRLPEGRSLLDADAFIAAVRAFGWVAACRGIAAGWGDRSMVHNTKCWEQVMCPRWQCGPSGGVPWRALPGKGGGGQGWVRMGRQRTYLEGVGCGSSTRSAGVGTVERWGCASPGMHVAPHRHNATCHTVRIAPSATAQ